jgi:tetratricopeptide (TPR) repeat protein
MADFNKAISLAPKNAIALYNRANTFAESGEYDRAIADYDRAIAANRKFVLGYYNRAATFRAKKDFARALKDYTAAIKNAPKFGPGYTNRALVRISLRQYDEAIADATMGIKLLPDNATNVQRAIPFGNRSLAYARKGDYAHAIADSEEALRLDPSRQRLRSHQAMYDLGGFPEKALPVINELLKDDDKDANAWSRRCLIHARLGKIGQAFEDCKQALTLDPNSADAFDARAFAHLTVKQFDKAVADYTTALKLYGYVEGAALSPELAEYVYLRGICRTRGGDALGGATDIAAAKLANPAIAEIYKNYKL